MLKKEKEGLHPPPHDKTLYKATVIRTVWLVPDETPRYGNRREIPEIDPNLYKLSVCGTGGISAWLGKEQLFNK